MDQTNLMGLPIRQFLQIAMQEYVGREENGRSERLALLAELLNGYTHGCHPLAHTLILTTPQGEVGRHKIDFLAMDHTVVSVCGRLGWAAVVRDGMEAVGVPVKGTWWRWATGRPQWPVQMWEIKAWPGAPRKSHPPKCDEEIVALIQQKTLELATKKTGEPPRTVRF